MTRGTAVNIPGTISTGRQRSRYRGPRREETGLVSTPFPSVAEAGRKGVEGDGDRGEARLYDREGAQQP